jgi:hypothetical protein
MARIYLHVASTLCLLVMFFVCVHQVNSFPNDCLYKHQNFTNCDVMYYTNWKPCTGGYGMGATECAVGYEKRQKAICCPQHSKNETVAQTTANCKAKCNLTNDDFEEIRLLTTGTSFYFHY